MKPTILLTGKNGQLGAELESHLPRLGRVVALDHQELDLQKPDDICRVIQDLRPQLIINAAAYRAVDRAEIDEENAYAINAKALAVIAEEAKKTGAALVHYSTDYVFDGRESSPRLETDPTLPINVYGKTKLAGEQAIRAAGIPHLIFRTSGVYGTRGQNFLLTILRLATENEELRIVRDQTGVPTWSREIARASTKILEHHLGQGNHTPAISEISGTYHMTAAGETTWYDFAKAILDEARSIAPGVPWYVAATGGRPLVVRRIIPISSQEHGAPAPRPAYSVLSSRRFQETFSFRLPDWRTQLHDAFASDLAENR
jgi:dTDP-4-dehydrorhamnose reductase